MVYRDGCHWGTGRRKTSTSRVRLKRGSGQFIVNGKDVEEFFCTERLRNTVKAPLKITKTLGKYDVLASVTGGGPTGQAGAVCLAVARSLLVAAEGAEEILRAEGLLTRDSRKVERKKYGRRGARRGFQFSKR